MAPKELSRSDAMLEHHSHCIEMKMICDVRYGAYQEPGNDAKARGPNNDKRLAPIHSSSR
jgi:hypothetical protein